VYGEGYAFFCRKTRDAAEIKPPAELPGTISVETRRADVVSH
jgi:hypothetical protein